MFFTFINTEPSYFKLYIPFQNWMVNNLIITGDFSQRLNTNSCCTAPVQVPKYSEPTLK